MSISLKKIEVEKNEFIRKLSQEQFDAVITSKYKKLFNDYFSGAISDTELANKNESYRDLVSVYTYGDTDTIDTNQYLYSAIVNVATDLQDSLNKLNLLASYFQLIASYTTMFEHLEDAINDAFYIYDKDCDEYLEKKLDTIATLTKSLDALSDELQKHQDVIDEVYNFFVGVDESIEKMYLLHMESLKSSSDAFNSLKSDCVNNTGARLDILHGEFING